MYTQIRAAEYVHQDPVQMFITATVGTPEIKAEFQSVLHNALDNERAVQEHTPRWRRPAIDPYSLVYKSTEGVLHDVQTQHILIVKPRDHAPISKSFNNSLTGARITLQAMSGLEGVYGTFPDVVHNRSNVERNMCRILRMTHSIAFGDAPTASFNLKALKYGVDPADKREALLQISRSSQHHTRKRGYEFSFDNASFAIEQDADGQLQISPKFELLKSPKDSPRCPATDTRVEGKEPDAPSRPGLHAFIRAIGEVVLDGIYPYRFKIDSSK